MIHAGPRAFSGADGSRNRFETWITLGLMLDVDGWSYAHKAAAHIYACKFPMDGR
jgi:hypothetical protein